MKTKLNAFTLVEMLTAMTITTIVVFLTYYSFRTVSGLSHDINSGLGQTESSYLLMADVERSFMTSENFSSRFNEVIFDVTNYDFGAEYTVRRQADRIDTFSNVFTKPMVGFSQPQKLNTLPFDSLSFEYKESRFTFRRNTTLETHVNRVIANGQN